VRSRSPTETRHSKVYHWDFKKTFGARPDQMPPGAKTFRWNLRKTLGPFPLESEGADPTISPEQLRRAAIRRAFLRGNGVELWLWVLLATVVIGGILFLLWLIDLGFHTG
jgi:hypothetical protein